VTINTPNHIFRFGEKPRNGSGSRANLYSITTPPPLPANGRRRHRNFLPPLPPASLGQVAPAGTLPTTTEQIEDSNQTQQLKNRLSWNLGDQSNPIPAMVTPEQQRQQQILQELPGIGTWAGRQRLFSVRALPQVPNSQVEDDLLTLEASSSSTSLKNLLFPASNVETSRNDLSLLEKEDTLSDMIEQRGRGRNGYKTLTTTTSTEEEEQGLARLATRPTTTTTTAGDGINVNGGINHAVITTATPPATRNTLQRTSSNTSSEARHISAAWKWRFTRKWEAEQRRVMETDPTIIAAEVDGGDDLDALHYLHACGMGLDLQMLAADAQQQQQRRRKSGDRGRGGGSRGGGGGGGGSNNVRGVQRSGIINAPEPSRSTDAGLLTSLRRDASSVSTATMQFEVEPSFASIGDLLSCEGSENVGSYLMTPDNGIGNASNPAAATRDLLSVAVRGRELLQRQHELEKEAEKKWLEIERISCGGASNWAGNYVKPVDIAMHGKFYFVVLKMSEIGGGGGGNSNSAYQLDDGMNRSGSTATNRQRMLVRGRPKATAQELLQEAISQAAEACAQNNLPYVSISIIGGGEMEWREDTDRHLMVSPAPKYLNMKLKSMNRISGGGSGLGGSPPDPAPSGDVCALAASLLHQALPLHFTISTRAQSLASQSNGTLL
jgi:hypothetical protein